MIERSETYAPDSPEVRIPREPSYEVKRAISFLFDPLYKTNFLRDIDFRIDLETLNRLRAYIGDEYVNVLEHTIVETRWRALRGVAVKMSGQTFLAASLSAGVMPPEFYSLPFLAIAGGDLLDKEDKDGTYQEVCKDAEVVIQKLLSDYFLDLYSMEFAFLQSRSQTISESIAKGETFSRPELTSIVYMLLNIFPLLALDMGGIISILAGVEAGILIYVKQYLKNPSKQRQLLEKIQRNISRIIRTTRIFGQGNERLRLRASAHGHQKDSSKNLQRGFQIVTQFLLPVLALVAKGGFGLALAHASQLSSHVSPIVDSEREISDAQHGVGVLKNLLKRLDDNQLTISTQTSWRKYCAAVKEQNLNKIEEPINKDVVAVFSPFSLTYPGKTEPQLILREPLELRAGFYVLSGGGDSPFLRAITQQLRVTSKMESIIQANKSPASSFTSLYNLDLDTLQDLIKYVYPESSESKLSPLEIFPENALTVPPFEFNPCIHNLVLKYKNGEPLKPAEEMAISYALRLLSGTESEIQISQEVAESALTNDDKSIILQLLPWARTTPARKLLVNKLKSYSFFTSADFETLETFKTVDYILRPLRAKLRLVRTLEDAEKQGTRVIAIDGTLDSISNTDTQEIIAYLESWSEKYNVSIVIATSDRVCKKALVNSQMYRRNIFFHPPFVMVEEQKNKRTKSTSQ